MDKGNGSGEWVKGMGSALSTARAARCGGAAAAAGLVCPWPLWNNRNFHLFHLFHLFHSSLLLGHG